MSWSVIISRISAKYGPEVASEIEDMAREEFAGQRITILKRKIITAEKIDKAAAGKPKEAAKKLGVHYSTIYRALNRRPIR